MDNFNLRPSELESLKKDLLGFVHRVSTEGSTKTNAEVKALPSIAKLLIENTGVIRLQEGQLKTVLNALLKAEYETTTDNGLVVTDLSEAQSETTWQLDYTELHKALNEAICILDMSVYSRKDDYRGHSS